MNIIKGCTNASSFRTPFLAFYMNDLEKNHTYLMMLRAKTKGEFQYIVISLVEYEPQSST